MLFQFGILLKVLPYRVFHVGCVVEECCQVADGVACHVEEVLDFLARDGFYSPDTCGDGAFGGDDHHPYLACRMGVYAAAQLDRLAEADDTHLVTVFFTEQCHCAHLFCISYRQVAVLAERDVLADVAVDNLLDLPQLFVSHLLVM